MTPLKTALDVGISLIPPALVGLIFYVVMLFIFRADKGERDAYARIEAEERAKRANALGEQP